MTGEVNADTDAMRACANQVANSGTRIQDAIEAADAGMYMTEQAFGLLLTFMPWFFHNAQANISGSLRQYGSVVNSVGDAVRDSADNYDTCDAHQASRMTTLGGAIQ